MPHIQVTTNWERLRDAASGDRQKQQQARRLLAEQYYGAVVKFLRELTADADLAGEVASDFFHDRILHPEHGSWLRSVVEHEGQRPFRGLLKNCLKCWVLPEFYRRRRPKEAPLPETADSPFDTPDRREHSLDEHLDLADIDYAFEQLKGDDAVGAEAFRLRFKEGMKLREIGERLSLTTSQANVRVQRFLKGMRRELLGRNADDSPVDRLPAPPE